MCTEKILKAIFVDIHHNVQDVARETTQRIPPDSCDLLYPPNTELSIEEFNAIKELKLNETARHGLEKLIAEACATVMFRFFTLADGVADPRKWDDGVWVGFSFCEKRDEYSNQLMLHDMFYESSWDFHQNE